MVEEGVVDVAPGQVAVGAVDDGGLRGGEPADAPGLEIDRHRGAVGAEVVGVDAAPVPDGEEDAVLAGGDRRHAVDDGAPGPRRPAVDGVAGVGGVVCAVELLEGEDVEHHPALGLAEGFRAVAEFAPGLAAIGHDGVFRAVPGHGQGGPAALGQVGVLQAEGVAELVPDGDVVVVAHDRRSPGAAEPDVAALLGRGRGEIGVGGGDAAGVPHPDFGGARGAGGEVEEGEALDREGAGRGGDACVLVEDPGDGGALVTGQGREAGRRAVAVAPVGGGRGGEAVGERPRVPGAGIEEPGDARVRRQRRGASVRHDRSPFACCRGLRGAADAAPARPRCGGALCTMRPSEKRRPAPAGLPED